MKKKRAKKVQKTTHRKLWSQRVTKESDSLTLEDKVFTKNPKQIAESLKRSAETSTRKKAGSFQSAMSMLNFYINRAGKNLSPQERNKLERAKQELRAAYGRN